MELVIEHLNDEKIKFDYSVFPNTNIVTVYRKRDLKKVEELMYCLCYRYATHEVAGNHFEIIFN
jgi:hypothetical protein